MSDRQRFVGVDLAAQATSTAVAVLTLHAEGLTVDELIAPADDGTVLRAAAGCAKVGIDAPLGWPDIFIDYLDAHRQGRQPAMDAESAGAWLDQRTYRATDLRLRADKSAALRRVSPLSVAADKLGRTALRCAGLQARMAEEWGHDLVRRDGSGRLVEVYPAASLAGWGMSHQGYKGRDGRQLREVITRQVQERVLPSLSADALTGSLVDSDHILDALIAALTAADAWAAGWRADDPAALTEGWIYLPDPHLETLAARVRQRRLA